MKIKKILTFITISLIALIVLITCKKDNFNELVGTCPQPQIKFTIALSSKPLAGGTTIGNGMFPKDSIIRIVAKPNVGYTFTNWTEGKGTVIASTDSSYILTLTKDTAFVANFTPVAIIKYTITLLSNPLAGGTTTGGGMFPKDSVITIAATPNVGYTFVNWTKGTTIVSTISNYSFTVIKDTTFVANFIPVAAGKYTATLLSNPLAGGTTTGGGLFLANSSVTIAATPNVGYTFVNWTKGVTIVSAVPNYTFILTKDTTFVANFTPVVVKNLNLTLSSNPPAGGTTIGSGSFAPNTSLTIIAAPNTGYTFVNWTKGATIVSANSSYTFTLTKDTAFVANFTPVVVKNYNVTLSSNPLAGGTTIGNGLFNANSSITIAATPNTGYTFVNWTKGATIISTSSSYTFTLTKDTTFVANFTPVVIGNFAVVLSSNPLAGGTTTGSGSFPNGSSVSIAATPNASYTFVNWTKGATIVSTTPNYTFILTKDTTFVANFLINTYTLNVTAVNGTVTKNPNQPTYNSGDIVQLIAIPALGYTFDSWSGDATGSTNPISITMNANKNITANFILVPAYTLTITAVNGSVVKNPNQPTYNTGSSVILTATPAVGYTFDSWSGDASGGTNPLTITMDANKNITANFTLIPAYTLNVTAVNGSVTKNLNKPTYNLNELVQLIAVPSAGYTFDSWSGDATGNTNPLTITMTANKNITANFILTPVTFILNVTAVNGTVVKNPNNPTYNSGASVILTPTPAVGYVFSSWSGDASGNTNPLTVTMTVNKNITANFTLIPVTYTLTITAVNGTVAKNPDQPTYNSGSSVLLTASPAVGYQFSSWSGDVIGIINPVSVTMTANKNITANFTLIPVTYTLNVTAVNGNVVKNPDQPTYNSGASVILTATPAVGYTFDSWSGDASGNTNPLTITMIANKNITANFTLIVVVCPTIVDLKSSGNYAIFAESGISTTGVTSITGDIGVNPVTSTAITGFALNLVAGSSYSTSSLVVGKVYAPDYAVPTPANVVITSTDMHAAYTAANNLVLPAPTTEFMAGNLNGQILTAGIYKWSSNVTITNGITLDGGDDDCSTFIFQVAQILTVANSAVITLQNGAHAKNIFWVVAGSGAVLGTTVDFSGNILCKTLISVNTGGHVTGRLLAQTAVTLIGTTVIEP